MKKGGLFLLTILFLTYGYQGYLTIQKYVNDNVKVKTSGRLSEIAGNVIPVSLETPDSGAIRQVRRVQRDGNDIFFLSENRLLHFDISGRLINQPAKEISNDEDLFIADYTLDTDLHRIIVIDSQRNISKYDYSGNLISKSAINKPWLRISAFTYHNGYLWASAETTEKITGNIEYNDKSITIHTSESVENNPDDYYQIINCLYQLDTDMNEISSRRLLFADIGRDISYNHLCVDELLIDEDGVYAYSTPVDMKYLLSDTLHILQNKSIPSAYGNRHNGDAFVYPVRKGKRYIMSTYHNAIDNCFTFCYDKTNNKSYMLSEGFKDDFYNTGYIADLQPMDIYNSSYCYIKSEADYPVLFIVTLKS